MRRAFWRSWLWGVAGVAMVALWAALLPAAVWAANSAVSNLFELDTRALDPASLSGVVYDAESGHALGGATVSVAGVGSTQTNSAGAYAFSNLTPGAADVTASRSGYCEQQATVNLAAGCETRKIFYLDPEAPGEDPVVVSVRGKYCRKGSKTVYLDGVSLNETFTATIDWKGHTPGTVEWIAPGGTQTIACSGATASRRCPRPHSPRRRVCRRGRGLSACRNEVNRCGVRPPRWVGTIRARAAAGRNTRNAVYDCIEFSGGGAHREVPSHLSDRENRIPR